jgi:hypothetical protein
LETQKTKNEVGVDIDNVNAKQGKNSYKLIEIIIERINVKTQKLSIRTLGKKCNNKESQFPSIIKMSKNESDLEDCNETKRNNDNYRLFQCFFKKTLNAWNFFSK